MTAQTLGASAPTTKRSLLRDALGAVAVALVALGTVMAYDAFTSTTPAPVESTNTTIVVPVPVPNQHVPSPRQAPAPAPAPSAPELSASFKQVTA